MKLTLLTNRYGFIIHAQIPSIIILIGLMGLHDCEHSTQERILVLIAHSPTLAPHMIAV